MLIAILVVHAVGGAAVFGAGRFGRRCLLVAAIAPAFAGIWLATRLPRVIEGDVVQSTVEWVPALGVEAALRLDAFAALFALVICAVAVAVLAYTWHYVAPGDGGVGRLAGLLTMFAGAMLLIVLADDLITLFTGWELTAVTSYLLIGNEHRKVQARAAALHALLVTSAGGLVLLAGIVLIGQAAGTYRLSALLADPPSGTAVTVGLVCVAIGAFTKSAQYPFHAWLTGAMAAPAPVSAFLHSATMVKAGVYLLARFAPAFAGNALWRPLVLTVGLVTMIVAAARALRQHDLKLLLALGTISQLGLLVVVFAAGTTDAALAGVVLLCAHAAYKAALFLVVGIVEHQTGTRDIRLLPPLEQGWRVVKAVTVLSAASMAGLPLLAGFVAKESAYAAFTGGPFTASGVVLAGVVAGSVLTFAYAARLVWGVVRPMHAEPAGDGTSPAPPPAAAFVAPAAALALFTVVAGVVPGSIDGAVGAAVEALVPGALPPHLALWHGLTAELWLTLLTLAAGAAMFALRRPVDSALAGLPVLPSATDAYLAALRALNAVAVRTTALVQNGSLILYAGTVLTTAALLPGLVLLTKTTWPGWPDVVSHPAQLGISAVIVAAAVAAAVIRRRFTAVLFLSAVGYAMAGLFVVQGAPDLALTQAAIETVSTVLFVLVLRKLPDRFERRSSPFTRSLRVMVAVLVAVTVFSFALISRESRVAAPVSDELIDRSVPEGDGRNVVNVILVDFRGFDTLGEITVLAAAAIGAVALARAGRQPEPQRRAGRS